MTFVDHISDPDNLKQLLLYCWCLHMRTRARAGLCGRGTDLRGMEEGHLALVGSVVTLNLCPCNIVIINVAR